jgi:hypothetical protein
MIAIITAVMVGRTRFYPDLHRSWAVGWVRRRGWGEARTTLRYWMALASVRMAEVRFCGSIN